MHKNLSTIKEKKLLRDFWLISVRADLGRAMGMRSEIRDRILPDKSFRLYPSALTTLHDIELLNSLKPMLENLNLKLLKPL